MYNLNYAVAFAKMDLDINSTVQDNKFLQWSKHCYSYHIGIKTDTKVKVAYLTPNEVFQVPLPKDYSGRYVKIGVIVNNRVVTLGVDETLALQNIFDDCGDYITTDSLIATSECSLTDGGYPWGFYYAPHYRNGQYVGEMYGVRGGFNSRGYYKVFKDQGIIQFDPTFPKFTYIFEYVPDGSMDLTGMSIIDLPTVNVIRAYIHWQRVAYGNTPSLAFTEMKKDEFELALAEFKHIAHCPTLDEWLDYSYRAYVSTAKR